MSQSGLWRDVETRADLQVNVPFGQQLSHSVSPQLVEVLVSDGELGRFISALQDILHTFLLKNKHVFLQQLLKHVPVDLSLILEVFLERDVQLISSTSEK